MINISHALGLHMHQPPENLRLLLETNNWQAKEIISCYARPVKYVKRYPEVAFLNIGYSGILLEQLTDPEIQRDFSDICKLDDMLFQYKQAKQIEIIGMGYYHPIFPLIPKDDWMAQLTRGREKAKEIFGVYPIGFWPSEMAFSMEMIPALRQAGYEYVIVDNVHIKLEREDSKDSKNFYERIYYKPVIAKYEDYEIVIVPRSRDISNAQESGLDPGWFEQEVFSKISSIKGIGPVLVTTWSDGENGGWFRQMYEDAGFWGHFFAPYMEKVREKKIPIKPTRLSDFINDYPPKDYVFVQTGAWNVGQTSGFDFLQWAGTDSQKQALKEVWEISKQYHLLEKESNEKIKKIKSPDKVSDLLSQAYNLLLKAETSCYFFWGDAWIPKVYNLTKPTRIILKQIAKFLS